MKTCRDYWNIWKIICIPRPKSHCLSISLYPWNIFIIRIAWVQTEEDWCEWNLFWEYWCKWKKWNVCQGMSLHCYFNCKHSHPITYQIMLMIDWMSGLMSMLMIDDLVAYNNVVLGRNKTSIEEVKSHCLSISFYPWKQSRIALNENL